MGKSFAVTDDGFLKKIRAAQFSNDMTRVVLDVNDVTEYSAFLLPNPYRLIIDIHGGSKARAGCAGGERADAAGGGGGAYGSEYDGGEGGEFVRCGGVECAAGQGGGDDVSRRRSRSRRWSKDAGSSGEQAGDDWRLAANATAAECGTKRAKKGKAVKDPDAVPARAAVPTADGETSLVRALGLKIGRIVIDAGHGGHDSGTIGVDGIRGEGCGAGCGAAGGQAAA